MKKLRPLLAALAATLLIPAAPAQTPGYRGLTGPYGAGTGDGRVGPTGAPPPVPAAPVQAPRREATALLDEASAALDEAMAGYAAVSRAARWQTHGGRNAYFFRDKARYRQAGRDSDDFSAAMRTAFQKLQAADEHLDEMEVGGDAYWALEGRVAWTRHATLFDILRRWGTRRQLKYDTWALGDEERRPLLDTADEVEELDLPRTAGVREGVVVMPSLVEPMAASHLDDLEASLLEAKEARELLTREVKERRDGSLTGWISLRYRTDTVFDSFVRPQAVRYALAMARAQAAFNAATLAVEAPTQGFSEADHSRLRQLMLPHARGLVWGDYHRLRVVDWKGLITRERFLFEGESLRGRFDLPSDGREAKHWESVLAYMKRRAPSL